MNKDPFGSGLLGEVSGFTLDSAKTGGRYDIIVSTPPADGMAERPYPLLIVLDANLLAGTVIEAAQIAMRTGEGARLIVAAVGTAGSSEEHSLRRLRDYLPAPVPGNSASPVTQMTAARILASGQTLEEGSGRADAFLAFLQEELLPRLGSDHQIDRQDIGLAGHSAAGAFASYALLKRAHPFSKLIVGSYGASWYGKSLAEMERAFAATADGRPRRVFHGMGGGELASPLFGPDLQSGADLLARLAASDPALEVSSRTFADETHASVASHILSSGLRTLWPGGAWGSAAAQKPE